MFNYLENNKEWIFSGAGVALLTFIISLIFKRKKSNQNSKTDSAQHQQANNIQDSPVTTISGKNIQFNQTLISNARSENHMQEKPHHHSIESPLLAKAKQDYIADKIKLRTFIYALVSPAKNIDTIIEIRNVTDSAEDIIRVKPAMILKELKEMQEEGLIEFSNGENQKDMIIGPYTRITVTKTLFATIKDTS